MPNMELVLGLLVAASALAALAGRIAVPYPIVLVIGGAALAAIPGVPRVSITPNIVFLVFLPPLLYASSLAVPSEELRDNARPILVLAFGLVLATVLAVAAVAHAVIGLSWPLSFVLGATLGATDPISATSIIRRLGAPGRIATILEGEALVNDGTALTAFKVAITAVTAHSFSIGHGLLSFVEVSIGGAAIGVLVSLIASLVRSQLEDPNLETTIGVMTAYGAYIAADRLGVSGVLSSVAAGLVASWSATHVLSPGARVQAFAFWEVVSFILNALLFLLIGLQLRAALGAIRHGDAAALAWQAAVVVTVVSALRMIWMFAAPAAARLLGDRVPGPEPDFSWREQLVLGYSGMRGALTVAAALSVPLTHMTAGGADARSLIIFFAFTATFVTLVLPGLTLTPIIRRLGLGQSERRLHEALEARARILRTAIAKLDDLAGAGRYSDRSLARVREEYEARIAAIERRLGDANGYDGSARSHEEERSLHALAVGAEQEELTRLRSERAVPIDILQEIQRDLDHEASRQRRV